MDCRAFGLVEHFRLDECFVYIFAHFSTEGVQFADEMAFGTAAYVGVAGHQGHASQVQSKQQRFHAHARGGQRRLASGVSRADDDQVVHDVPSSC